MMTNKNCKAYIVLLILLMFQTLFSHAFEISPEKYKMTSIPPVLSIRNYKEAFGLSVYFASIGDEPNAKLYLYRAVSMDMSFELEQKLNQFSDFFSPGLVSCIRKSYITLKKLADMKKEGRIDVQQFQDAAKEGEPYANGFLGVYYANKNELKKSRLFFEKAVHILPEFYSFCGNLADEEKDYSHAKKCFLAAIDHGDLEAFLALAILLSDKDADVYNLKEAESIAEEGYKKGMVYCRYMIAYLKSLHDNNKKINDVLAIIGDVSAAEEKTFFANFILGQIYENYGKLDEATSFFDKADNAQRGKDIRPKYRKFTIWVKEKNIPCATKEMEDILKLIQDPMEKEKKKDEYMMILNNALKKR